MFDKLLRVTASVSVTLSNTHTHCLQAQQQRLQHQVSSLSLGFANQLVFKHDNEKLQTQRTGLRFATSSEEARLDLAEGENAADYIGLFNRRLHVARSILCVVVETCVFILPNNQVGLSLYSSPQALCIHSRAAVQPHQLPPCAPRWLMFKQSKEPKHLRGPTRTSLTFPWMEVMTGESGR